MVFRISRYILISIVLSILCQSLAQELRLKERASPKLNPIITQKNIESTEKQGKISDLMKLFESSLNGDCVGKDQRLLCNTQNTRIFHTTEYLINNRSKFSAEDIKEIEKNKPLIDFAVFAYLTRDANTLDSICEINDSSQFFSSTWAKSTLTNLLNKMRVAKSQLGKDHKVFQRLKSTISCLNNMAKGDSGQLKILCESGTSDLSDSFPPMRDQTDSQWCFAYSAADVLSFYEKEDISPAYLAIKSHLESKLPKLNYPALGGYPKFSLELATDLGPIFGAFETSRLSYLS